MPWHVAVVSARPGLPPVNPMPAVCATSWHHSSLAVSDLDAAIAFYRDAFGYEVAFEERGMSDQIADMAGIEGLTCDLAQLRSALGDHVLELIAFHPPERGTPPLEAASLRPGAAHILTASLLLVLLSTLVSRGQQSRGLAGRVT